MSDFWSNELVTDYLDDRLSPEEKMRVDEHLQANPQDRGVLTEYQEMQKALRETQRYELDEGFSSRVVQSIQMATRNIESGETDELHQTARSAKKSSTVPWRYTASMIASLAVILLLAFFLLPRPQATDDMAKAQSPIEFDNLQTDSARSRGQEVVKPDSPSASLDSDLPKDHRGRSRGGVQSSREELTEGMGGGGLPSEPGAAKKIWDQLEMVGEDDTATFGGSTQDEAPPAAAADGQSKSMNLAEDLSDGRSGLNQSEARPFRESQLVWVTSSEANLAIMDGWGGQIAQTLQVEAGAGNPRLPYQAAENKIAGGLAKGSKENESTSAKQTGLGGMADGSANRMSPAAGEATLRAVAFEVEATEEQLQKLLQLIQAKRVTLNQENQKRWFEKAMQETANANLGALEGGAEQPPAQTSKEKRDASLYDVVGVSIRRIRLADARFSWQVEPAELNAGSGMEDSVEKQKTEQNFSAQRSGKARPDKRATGENASSEMPRQRFLLVVQLTPTDAAKPMPGHDGDSHQALPSGK